MTVMRTIQFYENGHCFHAIVVPRRSLPQKPPLKKKEILERLKCNSYLEVTNSMLVAHLAILLYRGDRVLDELKNLTRFVKKVAFDRIIPIGKTASSWESLATLVIRANHKRKHFAVVAKYVADDKEDPILLLSVSEGLVLCGDGEALETDPDAGGLRHRLVSWLELPD